MSVAQMLGTPGQGYVGQSSGTVYQADPTTGVISAPAAADIPGLLAAGATFGSKRNVWYNPAVIKAASIQNVVTSVALSNGALTIAAQADVPRPLQGVLFPGAAAMTAGTLTMVYKDSDGGTTTDVQSLITGSGVNLTFTTSKGVATLTSATVAAIAGGSSPGIQLGMNANISVPADVGATGITFYKATMDDTNDVLPAQPIAANPRIITPNTAPNATHTYGFGYSYWSS